MSAVGILTTGLHYILLITSYEDALREKKMTIVPV